MKINIAHSSDARVATTKMASPVSTAPELSRRHAAQVVDSLREIHQLRVRGNGLLGEVLDTVIKSTERCIIIIVY